MEFDLTRIVDGDASRACGWGRGAANPLVATIAAAFIIVANIAVDVLYSFIDPRVRLT
jgi:hypothetical protein